MDVTTTKTVYRESGISKRAVYLVLEGTFVVAIILLSLVKRNGIPNPSVLQIALFVLATFRLARTISFNQIAEGLREPFCYTKADSCGAGENVHAREDGNFRYVIGSLISCPICTSVWSALALFSIYTLWPAVGTILIYVLAFAGGSEVLHWGAELLEWGGRFFRVMSGAISPDEN